MMRALTVLLLSTAGLAEAAVSIFGPVPYQGRADSPFYAGIQAGTIFLEDFEDQLLNTPGVSGQFSGIYTGQGVDADDGSVDGYSFNFVCTSGGGPVFVDEIDGSQWFFDFHFEAAQQLGHPRFVGLTLLGFSVLPLEFEAFFRFRAYDANGVILPPGDIRVDAIRMPPGTPSASTVGDQFLGIYAEEGISRILVAAGRIDHLQYGWAVPEPGAVALAGLAGALYLRRRRRMLPLP